MEFWVIDSGKRMGPYAHQEFLNRWQQREFPPDAQVWWTGQSSWVRLDRMFEEMSHELSGGPDAGEALPADVAEGAGSLSTPAPEAGWYPDPEKPGHRRYWDGSAWTQVTAPASAEKGETRPSEEAPVEALAGGMPSGYTMGGISSDAGAPGPWTQSAVPVSRPPTPGGSSGSGGKVLLAIVAVIVVIWLIVLIGGSVGGPGQQAEIGSTSNGPESPERPSNTPTSPAPTERSGQQPPAHDDPATGVGAAVRDGKFEFVVKNVKCGAQNIGGQFGSDAQGEFCQIRITVKNIGDEPQDMFSDNQYALNAAGQEFSPDGSAMIFSANSDMWMSEINPGNSVSGELIYDVPRGTKLTKLEVHDSAFSSGATIDLR